MLVSRLVIGYFISRVHSSGYSQDHLKSRSSKIPGCEMKYPMTSRLTNDGVDPISLRKRLEATGTAGKCHSGPDPLSFCSLSGSTDNTNCKYTKNFFFSLAHTENTGKRAFFQFCMLGACLCFDNLEKRSLNWVIFARKGGLNLCLYSYTRQTS